MSATAIAALLALSVAAEAASVKYGGRERSKQVDHDYELKKFYHEPSERHYADQDYRHEREPSYESHYVDEDDSYEPYESHYADKDMRQRRHTAGMGQTGVGQTAGQTATGQTMTNQMAAMGQMGMGQMGMFPMGMGRMGMGNMGMGMFPMGMNTMGMGRMGMGQMGMAQRGQSATTPATGGQTTVANEVQRNPADTDPTEMGEEDGTVKGLADALVLLTKRMFEENKKKPTMPTNPSEETKKTTEPPKETTRPPKETTEPPKEPKEPREPMQPMQPREPMQPMQPMQPRHDSHDEVHSGRDGQWDPAHTNMFNWNPESRPTYDPSAEPSFMRQ